MYIAYLVLAGLQAWFATKKGWMSDDKGKARYLVLCCAELILLAALRGEHVGSDTAVYLDALEYYSSLPKGELFGATLVYPFDFEFGYFGFTKLFALMSAPSPVFLGAIAAIIYGPVFVCMQRYSNLPYISILAYFALGQFAYSLGFLRQMMALSIVLCAMPYLEKRKFFPFLLSVLVAATFHRSIIIIVVMYVAYALPLDKLLKFVVPLELACVLFGRPISLLIVQIVPKYAAYIGGKYDVQGGSYLMLVLLTVMLIALVYLRRRGFTDSKLTITALTLGVLLMSVAYSMAVLGRAVLYFSFFAIFAASEIVYVMTTKPELYTTVKNDVLAVSNRCMQFGRKHEITPLKILLFVAIAAFMGLALFMVLRNNYISPYAFWFTE